MEGFNIFILAAGESKRMGRIKQLIPYQGKTFIDLTISRAMNLGAEQVYVVLGAHLEKLKPVVSSYDVEIVLNPDWSEGMGRSLAIGAKHVLSRSLPDRGLLILLIDQPLIMSDPSYLLNMLRIWQKKPDIVVATKYGEKYGVPCLFPAEMVPRLVDCEGDRGAGPLLNSGTIEIVGLDAGKLNVDFDTETDLLGL